MLESTNTTRPFVLTPEGTYQFTVKELPLKKPRKTGEGVYFEFKFGYILDGKQKTHTEYLMPWDLPPLLQAFGFEEEPTQKGQYVWDRQACIGKTVEATIQHRSTKKDPTNFMAKMTEIKPVKSSEEIPF